MGDFEIVTNTNDDDEYTEIECSENENIVTDDSDNESSENEDYDCDCEMLEQTFHFKEDCEPIYCCDFNKDGNLIAFGSGNDKFFVFDRNEKKIIIESTKYFGDSVTSVLFNSRSQLCAAASLNGNIEVWDVEKKDCIWRTESEDQTSLLWSKIQNVLVETTNSGNIYLWHLKTNKQKVLPSAGSSCSCAVLSENSRLLLSAYDGGLLKLWDVAQETIVTQFKTKLTEIYSIVLNSNSEFGLVFGNRSESSLINLSEDSFKEVSKFVKNNHAESIETAVFIKTDALEMILTGDINGNLAIWDLKNQLLRCEMDIGVGITLIRQVQNTIVIAGTTNGHLYLIESKSGQVLSMLRYCKKAVLDIKVHADTKSISVCFDNGSLKVFELNLIEFKI